MTESNINEIDPRPKRYKDITSSKDDVTGLRVGNSLRSSILFSFGSNAWSAVLGILFVPIYLRYVGVEAYGVIGFFASVQAVLSLFDLGLSPSFSREISRLTVESSLESAGKVRSLARTLSVVNWGVTLLVGSILLLLSPLLASQWVNAVNLSVSEVTQCFLLIGVSFAAQFPQGLYNAGLAGLQRQVSSSIILIIFGTLRSVGALAVLALISPTIQAFLLWQTLVAAAQVVATIVTFYAFLPTGATPARFDVSLIKGLSRFAGGNLAIGITSIAVTQSDKLVLSKLVSLEEFGYYSLATMISSTALVMLVAAVTKVAFPQFSRLVALAKDDELRRVYHQNSQLVSVLIIPATVVLAVFAREILFAWTGNVLIAERSSAILALYSVGMGINCLLWLPNSMQLAHGWTRLTFYKNVAVIVFFIPFLFWCVSTYGVIGGAASWLALNVVYFVGYVLLMHRRILKGEALRWYFHDIALPLAASLPAALLGRYFVASINSRPSLFVFTSLVGGVTLAAAALSTPFLRAQVARYLFAGRDLIFLRS